MANVDNDHLVEELIKQQGFAFMNITKTCKDCSSLNKWTSLSIDKPKIIFYVSLLTNKFLKFENMSSFPGLTNECDFIMINSGLMIGSNFNMSSTSNFNKLKLVFGKRENFVKEIKCGICYEEKPNEKESLITNCCSNFICKECFEKFVITMIMDEKNILCPFCRKKHAEKIIL